MGNWKISVLRERFRKSTTKEKIINLFLLCLLVCTAVFLIEWVVWIIGDGYFFALPLFHQNWNDTFMDFFNVNYFVSGGRNPYTDPDCLSNYPPFALLIAKFFALFGDYSSIEGLSARGVAMSVRSSAGGIISLVLFFLVLFIGNFFALRGLLKKLRFSRRERLLISVVFALSAPVLFLFQRANYLGFSLLFVLIFLDLYDSESKWLREVSYISLAMAFGVKLYPIAFGIVLVKDRRWFAIVRTAVYCIVLFFVPFFFFSGGLANFPVFVKNMVSFAAYDTPFNNYSLYQIWYSICNLFKETPMTSKAVSVGKILCYCICLVCVASAFLCRKKWQSLLAASLFSIYITQPSYLYIGVMLFVPILSFLADEEKSKKDYFVLALFIVLMQPMYLGYIVYNSFGYQYHVTVSVFLQSLALLMLVICCVVFAVFSVKVFFSEKYERRRGEKKNGFS